MALRNMRVRPHLDDKVLTAWNGLMISAFAKGAQVLGDERYLNGAKKSAAFIQATMWSPDRKILLRRWRAGDAAIDGFLDDYAFFALALLDLYETNFDPDNLTLAATLAERIIELFGDPNGGFFSTAVGDPSLVMRLKEDYDGAEPSGNSMAATLMLRLAAMTGREEFNQAARATFDALADRLNKQTAAVPQLLCAWMMASSPDRQVEFGGADPSALIKAVHVKFTPFVAKLRGKDVDGPAVARVCEHFVCKLPTSDPASLAAQVE